MFSLSRFLKACSVPAAWLLSGCSSFADGDATLQVGQMEALPGGSGSAGSGQASGNDAVASGSSADWSCLGAAPVEPPGTSGGEPAGSYRYTLPVVNELGRPVVGARVKACGRIDVDCSMPFAETTTNASGLLTLEVPAGYQGFLEVEFEDLFQTVFHIRSPVRADTVESRPIVMIPPEILQPVAEANGIQILAEDAFVVATVVDCSGERAAGVSFSNNVGGLAFNFQGGLPTLEEETDSQGAGGFANLQPVAVVLRATVAATGQLIGRRAIIPRGGWNTFVEISPGSE